MSKLLLVVVLMALTTLAFGGTVVLFYENFDENGMSMPPLWTGDFYCTWPGEEAGYNDSQCAEFNAYDWGAGVDTLVGTIVSPPIGPFYEGAELQFMWRVIDFDEWMDMLAVGKPFDSIEVYLGENLVHTYLGGDSHTPTGQYKEMVIPLDNFLDVLGETEQFKMVFTGDVDEDVLFHLDEVKLVAPTFEGILASLTLSINASANYMFDISGNISQVPVVNANSDYSYTISMTNTGLEIDTSTNPYTLHIMEVNPEGEDVELNSITGLNIAQGESRGYTFDYSFLSAGMREIYAMAVFDTDTHFSTLPITVTVVAATSKQAYIGSPNSDTFTFSTPISIHNNTSLSQTIYTAEELDVERGYITHIGYKFWNVDGWELDFVNIELWMGNTEKQSFEEWIPTEEMTLVYTGRIPITFTGRFEILIELDTPFLYTGDNLVIMAYRPFSDYAHQWENIAWIITMPPAGTPNLTLFTNATTNSIDIDNLPNNNLNFRNWRPNTTLYIYSVDDDDISESDYVSRPLAVSLLPNYPNPFNPATTITFSVGTKMSESNTPHKTPNTQHQIAIDIYNIKGQKVRSLVNGEYAAGIHSVIWNGNDDNGQPVGSGLYFYRLKTNNQTETRKMILIK